MTIDSLKQLEQIMRMCQRHGVDTIKVDNVEMTVNLKPKPQTYKLTPDEAITVPKPNIRHPDLPKAPDESVSWDDLTDEQKLTWSSAPAGVQA